MMEARGRTPAVQDVAPTGLTRVLMLTQRLRAGLNYAAAARLHRACRCAAPSCLPPRGSIVPGAARLHRARRCAAPSCPALRGSIVPGAARLHRARALRDSIVPGRCATPSCPAAARLHRARRCAAPSCLALRGSIVPGRCAAPSCPAAARLHRAWRCALHRGRGPGPWLGRLRNLRVAGACLAGLWHVRRIAGFGPGHLYSLFAFRPLIEPGAAIFHAQAHFPTKPA